jgi:uncharacterized BrkB/YihY/UPF0761 family membrane protein
MTPEQLYFLGAWVAYGAGVAACVFLVVYSFMPQTKARLRDWVNGAASACVAATIVGVALCVASHLRWQ